MRVHLIWCSSLLLLFVVAACGGYQPPAIGACGDGTALDEEECSPGSFIAADRCFSTRDAACGCLGCVDHRCQADDSDPAEVSCKAE